MRSLRLLLVLCAVALPACGGTDPGSDERHGKPLTTATHTGPADRATEP